MKKNTYHQRECRYFSPQFLFSHRLPALFTDVQALSLLSNGQTRLNVVRENEKLRRVHNANSPEKRTLFFPRVVVPNHRVFLAALRSHSHVSRSKSKAKQKKAKTKLQYREREKWVVQVP